MSVFHDEVEIEDMEYDEENEIYYYPCPCGDRFQISKVKHKVFIRINSTMLLESIFKEDLENGEEVATCPSCSLIVKVIYDKVSVFV